MHPTDAELLQRYVQAGAASDFTPLVTRHLDLVYSIARRQLGSSALAGDIAQAVFLELAQNASTIKAGTPLVAWLYVVTRRIAANTTRGEARRRAREITAAQLAEAETSSGAMTPSDSAWPAIEPLLEEAVDALGETDRAAVLLRFFENKSLREIGATLGVSDDAAQKRVARALDQLRAFFLRRGLPIGATTLAHSLSAHALQTAPLGLGASIAAAAATLPAATTAATGATTLAMTTLQKTLAATVLTAALGGVIFETTLLHAQRAELAAARDENERLAAQIRQQAQPRALAAATPARPAIATPRVVDPADAALEAQMRTWLANVDRLQQLRRARPELTIPELALLSNEDWFSLARRAKFDSEEEIREMLGRARRSAESKFTTQLRAALRRYVLEHDGFLPDTTAQLAGSFDTPPPPEAFRRYTMIASGRLADLRAGSAMVIELNAPVDFAHDDIIKIGLSNSSSIRAMAGAVDSATLAFTKANSGTAPRRAEDLLPFLPRPIPVEQVQPYFTAERPSRP